METAYDPTEPGFNHMFAKAGLRYGSVDDGSGFAPLKVPNGDPFLVENIYTDMKRHDMGPDFHERNFDGTVTTECMTEPLWGVGSMPPYGHDGRSINLTEVIMRHGGDTSKSRDKFAELAGKDR